MAVALNFVKTYGIPIIAFAGHAGSGKTQSAVAVQLYLNEGKTYKTLHHVVHFATPLKKMVAVLTESLGIPIPAGKETVLCGTKTIRYALQTLGTEWGRKMIDQDLWVKCMEASLNQPHCSQPPVTLIDDVRFPNEVAFVHAHHGVVIWVDAHRRLAGKKPILKEEEYLHASELSIDALKDCDFTIGNELEIPEERSLLDYGKFIIRCVTIFSEKNRR